MFVCTANSIALSNKLFSQVRHVQCMQNGEEAMLLNNRGNVYEQEAYS